MLRFTALLRVTALLRCSAEALTGILGHAGLQLFAQQGVIEIATDQDQLVLALAGPVAVIDGEAFASQVEDVAAIAFVEPENPLGAEHRRRQLIVEEVLELAQGEGAIAAEGEGGVTLDR